MRSTVMMRMPTVLAMAGVALMSLNGCGHATSEGTGHAASSVQDAALIKEIEEYRQRRVENLVKPDGWTAIIGMSWLEPGRYTVGSAADSDIRLRIGPARVGVVEEEGRPRVVHSRAWCAPARRWSAADRPPVELKRYERGSPAITVGYDGGKGLITLIVSGGRRALRVHHADAPARLNFAGLDYWPIDAGWRIKGRSCHIRRDAWCPCWTCWAD